MGQSLGLLDCSLRGSLVCSFRVTLRRKWKSCKNNLHPMCLFVFSRILGSSQGLYGIRGHSLSHLSLFFVHPGLLGHFRRAAKGGKDLLKAAFLWISHLGRGVCLGATGGGGMNGLGVVDTFWLPKYRRSLNPSLVDSFIPYLGTVSPTYPWDLSPKGFLGLSHSNIITLLLCLLPSFFCFLLGFLYLILGLLDLLQFLLQCNDLLLKGNQLVLSNTEQHSLAFCLSFNAVQGSCSAFSFSLLFGQLGLKLLNAFFSHMEGIHGCYPSSLLLLLHFSMGVVHHLLGPKGGLDGLEEKGNTIKIYIYIYIHVYNDE